MKQNFTKYEITRIIGARALQIAMDAPILLKVSEEELKKMRYDSLKIAERELKEDVLPIAINRPTPQKNKEKIVAIKEKSISDEELAAKQHEEEKEIVEDAKKMGLVEGDEIEDYSDEVPSSSKK